MSPFRDPLEAADWVVRIAALGAAVSSLELLWGRAGLRDDGLMSWSSARLRHAGLAAGVPVRWLDLVFGYPWFLAVIGIQFLLAAFLVVQGFTDGRWLLPFAALLAVAVALRSPYGLDGADQMTTTLFVASALAALHPTPRIVSLALWFVALQACLSYGTAGFAKVFSPAWRSSAAVVGILRTRTYGHAGAFQILQARPRLSLLLGAAIVGLECAFPLVLVGVEELTVGLLVAGFAFHAAAALLMGLNSFFWAFLATYPAIAYCALRG